MTRHRITYHGPASLAVGTATALADARGVELLSAEQPERLEGVADTVRLHLVLDATADAVAAAVEAVRASLPPGATITMEEGGGAPG